MTARTRGILAAIILTCPLRVATTQQAATGIVAGYVTDSATSAPRAGVTVSVAGTPRRATANAEGRFVIAGLPAGPAQLQLRVAGYRAIDTVLTVVANDTVRVSLRLAALATMLGAVNTEVRSIDRELFVSKPNIGTVSVTARAMDGMPRLGEPDVVRVVQLLPGVGTRNDFTTGFNVRGGESSQNLIMLDGLPIYNPFHLGGLFSTFIDASLRDVTFIAGSFPARYGGRLSSVLDAHSMDPGQPGVHGAAEVSVIASTLQLGGTVNDGRGSWMLAGRRTYADKLADMARMQPLPYHFRDGQARVTYELPRGVKLAVTAFDGRDVLDLNMAEAGDSATNGASAGTVEFSWGNRAARVTLTKTLAGGRGGIAGALVRDSALLSQSLSRSGFSTAFDAGDGAHVLDNSIVDRAVGGSFTSFGRVHDLSAGYEVVAHRVNDATSSPETGVSLTELRQSPTSAAAYVDDIWRVGGSSKWLVQTGLRFETLTGADWSAVSPRVSAKYFVTPDLAVSGAVGRFSQWMHSLTREDTPIRFFDFWQASDATTPVATAWHSLIGVEKWVGANRFVRLESFYKRYDRLLEYDPSEDQTTRGDEFLSMGGHSYGADVMLRQLEQGPLSGWIAYSYALSSRTLGGKRYLPAQDRRHDLDVTATWRFGKYTLGSRFGYGSGTPYTEMVGQLVRRTYDLTRNQWGTGGARGWKEWIGGPRNGNRYPATQRFDVSLTRQFRRGGTELSPYVSLVNAYNAKNVFLYTYNFSVAPPERRKFSQLPIVPTVGLAVRF